MNGELRRAINVKNMLKRKFDKFSNKTNWNKYKLQRNLVTKLRKKGINVYLQMKCNTDVKGNNCKGFWDTVKPLISSKCGIRNDNIIRINGDDVYTKPRQVAAVFNTYFTNIALNIGLDDSCSYSDNVLSCLAKHRHLESVQNIKQFMESREMPRGFTFDKVDTVMVKFFLNKLKPNKATGCDMLPSKLLKMASDILSKSICYLVILSITMCRFPNELKSAEITPLFKKGNNLDVSSYRPVSVLPSF